MPLGMGEELDDAERNFRLDLPGGKTGREIEPPPRRRSGISGIVYCAPIFGIHRAESATKSHRPRWVFDVMHLGKRLPTSTIVAESEVLHIPDGSKAEPISWLALTV
jgi:hypothetical protein